MALKGRAGHRCSHAPQPIHRSSLTIGTFGESGLVLSDATICIAPTGQCRAQLPHSTPSVSGMQLAFTHTACPICIDDFSARLIFTIAPAGHTSEQRVHSGRQYPLSYEDRGCMSVSRLAEGLRTLLGHAATHSWHPVQWLVRCLSPIAPGGTIGVFLSGIFLSVITARPPSTVFCSAWSKATELTAMAEEMKLRRPLSALGLLSAKCLIADFRE